MGYCTASILTVATPRPTVHSDPLAAYEPSTALPRPQRPRRGRRERGVAGRSDPGARGEGRLPTPPTPGRVDGLARQAQFALRRAPADGSQRFRRGVRDVEGATGIERAAVVDANGHG